MRQHLIFAALVLPLALLPQCTCGQPGLIEGSDCTTAQECQGDLVCDVDTGTCATVGCETHDECGVGAYCEDGECADNIAGGPCVDDTGCVGGEQCRNGVCREQGSAGSPCTTAEGCVPPLVCEPDSLVCTGEVSCAFHSDCGDAAYCDDDGDCVPSGPAAPCTDDDTCITGEHCVGVVCVPEACQGDAFNAEPTPANVMIVFDRSGSMDESLGPDGTKWDVGREAIDTLLASASSAISFGLSVYPGYNQSCSQGGQCQEGDIPYDLGADRQDIVDYLNDADTCMYGTPTAENLETLLDLDSLQDPTRNNFVLLVTDGQSTCDNPVPVVGDLYDLNPSVKTFVVGFGNGVDPDELEDMATAGGTARPTDPAYYQADDAVSLQAALTDIVGAVLGCEYTVSDAGDDPDQLYVYFNGTRVPRDPTGQTGWDVDLAAGRITFAGNACTALQSGIVTDLTLVYGCPLPGEPPPPDAGTPDDDAGVVDPPIDAGPDGCADRCVHNCGTEACLIPGGEDIGTCGPCGDDGDCCPGSLCLPSGACIPVGG